MGNIISASIFFIIEFILALASDYGRDFDSAISQIEEFFLPTIIIYDFHHQKILLIVVNLILSFLLIVNILLLFGTTKGKPMFLLPWLVFHMISTTASTTISVLIIYIPLYYQQYNLTSTLQNSVILMVINVFCYYFWFLVFSTYRYMKKENRTLLLVLDEEIKFSK